LGLRVVSRFIGIIRLIGFGSPRACGASRAHKARADYPVDIGFMGLIIYIDFDSV
jgi:hypothetical protein